MYLRVSCISGVSVCVVPAADPGDGWKNPTPWWSISGERVRERRTRFDSPRFTEEPRDVADTVVEIEENWKSMKLHGRKILCVPGIR